MTVNETAEAAVTVAFAPPKNTILPAGTVLKLLPWIVTAEPMMPDRGEKDVTTGGGPARNLNPGRLETPPKAVTDTLPVEPPATCARMVSEETTVKEAAGRPPNATDVTRKKFVPMMVTVVPLPAESGEKEVMAGGGIKVKPGSVPVP